MGISSIPEKIPVLSSPASGPFQAILLNHRTNKNNFIYQYVLPSYQKKGWPEKTSLWCYHCVHPFDSVPIPIPATVDRVTGCYGVYGNFCSFQCAAGWLRDRNFPDVSYQRSLLSSMASEIFDYLDAIKPAPPQIRLKVFGGDMSIEVFRKKKISHTIRSIVRNPPFVQYPMVIEEHTTKLKTSLSLNILNSEEEDVIWQSTHREEFNGNENNLFANFVKKKEENMELTKAPEKIIEESDDLMEESKDLTEESENHDENVDNLMEVCNDSDKEDTEVLKEDTEDTGIGKFIEKKEQKPQPKKRGRKPLPKNSMEPNKKIKKLTPNKEQNVSKNISPSLEDFVKRRSTKMK